MLYRSGKVWSFGSGPVGGMQNSSGDGGAGGFNYYGPTLGRLTLPHVVARHLHHRRGSIKNFGRSARILL
jgi:hypothetical protein